MKAVVFCYGTLKTSYRNNRLLEGQTFVCACKTKPIYLMYDTGGFPVLVHAKKGEGKAIEGELWEVDGRCLAQLDRLEGVPYLYRREFLELDGFTAQGYVYCNSVRGLEECGTNWTKE